jgi:hypothetical protein
VPDNGIAVERREAPGPTLLGPRARKRQPLVTGDLPWRAPNHGFGFGTRGDPRVAPPGAPFPFWGNGKRETTGRPGRPSSKPGFAKLCPKVQWGTEITARAFAATRVVHPSP